MAASLPFFGSKGDAGPSTSTAAAPSAAGGSETLLLFVRLSDPLKPPRSVYCPGSTTVRSFWEGWVAPLLRGRAVPPTGLRFLVAGRTIEPDCCARLVDVGVSHLSTIEVAGRLPSQGFSRLHQLLENLVETLAPVASATAGSGGGGGGKDPPADDEPSHSLASREPIMHAIDTEIGDHRAAARCCGGGTSASPCHCMACTLRPNSALRLCGTLLHSNDVAVIGLTHRVVQYLLRARVDCCAPVASFSEATGALVLLADEGHRWLYDAVVDALTPEGVAVAALLTLRLSYDAKTHPLLWQHPTKKQTLLEMAARAPSPDLLLCLMPALHLSRLASSGALQAVSMASYKALHAMALHGRHELLSLLLGSGAISAQHVSLLLETALQKKGKQPLTERVAAEMVRYVGPLGSEAASLLKVAAGHSSAAVVAMLLDLSLHDTEGALDLEAVGLALAEACDFNNDEAMELLLLRWKGRCAASQAQPLVRAFSARGDAERVERLLATGKGGTAMVRMDSAQRSALARAGLAHAAGSAEQRTRVLRTLLAAGADAKSEHGEAALRNAARDGHAEAMELLLGMGTNVNAVDEDGKTVLCVAAQSGGCASVHTLLEHGAQVRMRCPDGREPLDFAVDESVRALLLAEVEKLRMGLLDELLAEEELAAASAKGGGKSKSKKAKKAEKAEQKASAAGSAAANANGTGAAAEGARDDAGGDDAGEGGKKKKKKKKGAAEGAASVERPPSPEPELPPPKKGGKNGKGAGAVARNGEAGAVHSGGGGCSLLDVAVSVLGGGNGASPKAMRLSSLISALYERSASFKEEIRNAGGAKSWLTLHSDAFILDTDGPAGQESVKLRTRPKDAAAPVEHLPPPPPPPPCDDDADGGAGAPEDASLHLEAVDAAAADDEFAAASITAALAEEGLPPPLPPPRPRSRPQQYEDDSPEGLPPPLPPPPGRGAAPPAGPLGGFGGFDTGGGLGGLLGGLGGAEFRPQGGNQPVERAQSASGRFGAIGSGARGAPGGVSSAGAPGAGGAALGRGAAPARLPGRVLSLESMSLAPLEDDEALLAEVAEADPLGIEKKIRAIQKKLRRVQEIEERAARSLPVDGDQLMLLGSKPKLQRSLRLLLDQWAVLEPRLIEQQAQRMAALANSECAVCLEEYSSAFSAIRTSCCGYHFHKTCLQQCIESKGHCPICFADKTQCRVVEQRVRSGHTQ